MGSGRRVKGMMWCGMGAGRGEEWSAGVKAWGKAAGGMGWEEAKMACEITSDAILPI